MKVLYGLWACVVVGAAVATAADMMEQSTGEPPFALFTMREASVNFERLKIELNPKLAYAKRETRRTLLQDAMEAIENCFAKAAMMSRYVSAQRRKPPPVYQPTSRLGNEESASSVDQTTSTPLPATQSAFESDPTAPGQTPGSPLEVPHGKEAIVSEEEELVGTNWALFNFHFEAEEGDDRLQYMEDLAWAVKDVVDIYDHTPLCKAEILKKESRGWRFVRKLSYSRMSKKSLFDLVLSIALHKALYDWAENHGKSHLFTGEEVPLLVATAREAHTKRGALERLNRSLAAASFWASKSRQMTTVLVSQYITTHLGRASELALSELWKGRYPPPELRPVPSEEDVAVTGSSGPSRRGSDSGGERDVYMTANSDETPRSPEAAPLGSAVDSQETLSGLQEDGGGSREAESGTTPQRPAEDLLASASLFNILTRSRFRNITALISQAEQGTVGEILGYEGHGGRVIETFPCPENFKHKLIDAEQKEFGFFKRTVLVYKYTGLQPGGESSISRNETAIIALTAALERMDGTDLEKLFLVAPGALGDIRQRVEPLFPTMCFSNKKQAARILKVDKKFVHHLLSEVPIRYMKKFPKMVEQFARTEASKIGDSHQKISKLAGDAKVSAGKLKAVTSFVKAAFAGVGIFIVLGVALVGIACIVGMATATLVAVPACTIAALIFGPWTFFVVATPLTLGAIGLGSLAWTLAVTSSVKSALRLTLSTLVLQKRERYLHMIRSRRPGDGL